MASGYRTNHGRRKTPVIVVYGEERTRECGEATAINARAPGLLPLPSVPPPICTSDQQGSLPRQGMLPPPLSMPRTWGARGEGAQLPVYPVSAAAALGVQGGNHWAAGGDVVAAAGRDANLPDSRCSGGRRLPSGRVHGPKVGPLARVIDAEHGVCRSAASGLVGKHGDGDRNDTSGNAVNLGGRSECEFAVLVGQLLIETDEQGAGRTKRERQEGQTRDRTHKAQDQQGVGRAKKGQEA